MSNFSFQPLNVLSMPNHFHDMDQWILTSGQQVKLYLQLLLKDQLGERRYIPETGATVKIKFMRARDYKVSGQGSTSQTFEIHGVLEGQDRSIASFDVTKDQSKQIYPGTVLILLTENGKTTTIKRNFIIKIDSMNGGC